MRLPSDEQRCYVQSAIPILGTRMARSCGLGRVHMQTLALISFYAPVVIIILAVVAVLFSFFWVFLPMPRSISDRDGPAAGSILALARPATAVKLGRSGKVWNVPKRSAPWRKRNRPSRPPSQRRGRARRRILLESCRFLPPSFVIQVAVKIRWSTPCRYDSS